MNRFFRIVLALAAGAAVLSAVARDQIWLKGATDKDAVAYRCGETMTFRIDVVGPDEELPTNGCFIAWTRTGDDGLREEGKEPIVRGPFVYRTKIDRPGFVRLQAKLVDEKGQRCAGCWSFFDGGAAAEIDKLETRPEPKDFDDFWARQFARLDRVPVKADLVEITNANRLVSVFAVRIDCAGLRPVTGYLACPKAVAEGRTYPARLRTHGYNGDAFEHLTPHGGFTDREIVLTINAHGLKLAEFGATEADRKALRWEARSHDLTYAFDPKQNADPETAYFNGMVLRVKRALQYLKTVKGWNGRDLVASGGSQGGLQTIWAASCGEGVTRAEAEVPWNCDVYTNGRLRRDEKSTLARDNWYIEWVEGLDYYDAVNFARRIPASCRTDIVRAGLGDYCCPPTGIAKLWNAIPGNKRILWMQGSQHGTKPRIEYEGRDFIYTKE